MILQLKEEDDPTKEFVAMKLRSAYGFCDCSYIQGGYTFIVSCPVIFGRSCENGVTCKEKLISHFISIYGQEALFDVLI